MKYETYPCDKCGRKITQGNRTKEGIVCNPCYKKINPNNWLDSIIKIGEKNDISKNQTNL